jgi:DNA-binding MarR family transcriptional regulator
MASLEVPVQVAERTPVAPAARSVRRATARRASARRASARRRQSDGEASIIGFLANHPRSTVGDLARNLNLDPRQVGACLTQLAGAGEVRKASDGYSIRKASDGYSTL